MPTLMSIEVPTSCAGETMGETAHASDLAGLLEDNNSNNLRPNDGDTVLSDESTWSGSVLASALEEMRRLDEYNSQKRNKAAAPEEPPESPTSSSLAVSQQNRAIEVADKHCDDSTLSHSFEMPLFSPRKRERPERKIGPNELKYTSHYKDFVSARLEKYSQRHPGKLRDYRSMDVSEKEREQECVMNLLSRLRITKKIVQAEDDESTLEPPAAQTARASLHRQEMARTTDRACDDDSTILTNDNEKSMALLSPSNNTTIDRSMALLSPQDDKTIDKSTALLSPKERSGVADTSMALLSSAESSRNPAAAEASMALLSQDGTVQEVPFPAADDSDCSSTQSIELARSTSRYDSPAIHHTARERKRMATTSGKRGADYARARMADSSSPTNSIATESPLASLESSVRRLSLAPNKVFTASQSPISPHFTCSMPDDDSSDSIAQPNISFGDDESPAASPKDSIVDVTLDERRVRWNLDDERQPFRDVPGNIALKKGATFHYKPLKTARNQKQRRAPPTESFPDPLDFYEGRSRHRLRKIYKWMCRRDEGHSGASGMILSLTEQQIIAMTLKLLLEYPPPETQQSQSQRSTEEATEGQSLVIARDKETLEDWSRALREGSAFSVLNHSTLPLKERKSQTTASKCSKYDVVITTFDALKAPDVTVTLDDDGHVVPSKLDTDDGWFTSRSASQADTSHHNKQMSVLHQIKWRRVVFADILGRKCFLAKPETSRTLAARALNAESRFIFFLKSNDEDGALEALKKSDRKALLSVSSALRLDSDGTEEAFRDALVDLKDETTLPSTKRK